MTDMKPDMVLDATGMNCPLPVLKTKKALEGLKPGQFLLVRATDRGSMTDIPALLTRLGHGLLEVRDQGDLILFYIVKK
ncbi:MAG: sulfurtransferase TusA family protein [Nitrospirae bacterium]|nr:MAG: sulfurtransferase TusA family protein [Nitrospirota bacterium]